MSETGRTAPQPAPAAGQEVLTPPAAGQRPTRLRVRWIDQARWLAIVLVVSGHLAGLVRSRSELARIYSDFVYTFHIPVLVLLAGWGARRAKADARGLTKIFWQLLVPYAIFQNIAFGVSYLLKKDDPTWSFGNQTYGLWFLVALAGWRLLAPWFRGFRHPASLALAVALVAGLSPEVGGFLSLSRLFYFLPLFVAGPWIVDRVGRWRRDRRRRALAGAVLFSGAGWVTVSGPLFDRGIFLGVNGYASLHQGVLEGMAHRAGAIAMSTVLALAFCVALPGQPGARTTLGTVVARAGRHTMYPYLFHLPLLTVLVWTGWADTGPPLATTIAAIALGLVVSILMVSRPLRTLTGPFVEPRSVLGDLTSWTRR